MKILDLSAGNRAIWYDKNNPLCTYLDIRECVKPDIVIDTNILDLEKVGNDFDLIVWDPPHMNCGPNSNMSKTYGYYRTKQIYELLEKTSKSVVKCCKPNALMALKWNSHDIKLIKVFQLLSDWEPLFGHLTKDGPRSQTYWVMLKLNASI